MFIKCVINIVYGIQFRFCSVLSGETNLEVFAVAGVQGVNKAKKILKAIAPKLSSEEYLLSKGDWHFAVSTAFYRRVLLLPPGARAVVVNGQLYGPFLEGEDFIEADMKLLDKKEVRNLVAAKVANLVKGLKLHTSLPGFDQDDISFRNDIALRIASMLHENRAAVPSRRRMDSGFIKDLKV